MSELARFLSGEDCEPDRLREEVRHLHVAFVVATRRWQRALTAGQGIADAIREEVADALNTEHDPSNIADAHRRMGVVDVGNRVMTALAHVDAWALRNSVPWGGE